MASYAQKLVVLRDVEKLKETRNAFENAGFSLVVYRTINMAPPAIIYYYYYYYYYYYL